MATGATTSAETLAQRVIELIDIPSVSRDEERLLSHIASLMPSSFEMAYRGDAVAYFRPAQRSKRHTVVLAGHTDTVPIAGNVPAQRSGDEIHGRGASDMKGGLAVMVELARRLDGRDDSDFDVGFLFFGREELPSDESALVPALEESEELRAAQFAILMEPTANALELGCQGNLNLTLVYTGVAAHSARPWAGVNAAHAAVSALNEMAAAAPHDVEIDGLVFREVANITAVRGGIARNVIPDRVEVDVNIRYAPNRSAPEAELHWGSYFSGANVEVKVASNAAPAPVVRNHPLAQRLLDAGAGAPMPKQAWTNAADFAAYGIPALNFGPGDPLLAHRDDESVKVSALADSLATLQRFVDGSTP